MKLGFDKRNPYALTNTKTKTVTAIFNLTQACSTMISKTTLLTLCVSQNLQSRIKWDKINLRFIFAHNM